jgi:hypothetical protein
MGGKVPTINLRLAKFDGGDEAGFFAQKPAEHFASNLPNIAARLRRNLNHLLF